MDDFLTLEKLKIVVAQNLNNLVLDYFDVVRLVDAEETDEDFYWVYESSVRGIYRSSCVGSWIKLKGLIADKDYNYLVRIWNLNSRSEVKAV